MVEISVGISIWASPFAGLASMILDIWLLLWRGYDDNIAVGGGFVVCHTLALISAACI